MAGYKIIEKDNPLAVHGLFDCLERAERHLRDIIPGTSAEVSLWVRLSRRTALGWWRTDMNHYERLIFEDGKIRARHDAANFTRDATPDEVWAELKRLESELETAENELYDADVYRDY